MNDPNYPPQPSYPSPASQTGPQQYSSPSQQPQASPYAGQQYAQNPQANPYGNGQQYVQNTPQYNQPQYQQPQYAPQQYAAYQPADSGSFGWAVLGFLIPLVGLILYLVWRNDKPLSAKKAGMGALVSVLLSVALWVLMFMLLTFGVATYSSTL